MLYATVAAIPKLMKWISFHQNDEHVTQHSISEHPKIFCDSNSESNLFYIMIVFVFVLSLFTCYFSVFFTIFLWTIIALDVAIMQTIRNYSDTRIHMYLCESKLNLGPPSLIQASMWCKIIIKFFAYFCEDAFPYLLSSFWHTFVFRSDESMAAFMHVRPACYSTKKSCVWIVRSVWCGVQIKAT